MTYLLGVCEYIIDFCLLSDLTSDARSVGSTPAKKSPLAHGLNRDGESAVTPDI
jgi:hypothetical protein